MKKPKKIHLVGNVQTIDIETGKVVEEKKGGMKQPATARKMYSGNSWLSTRTRRKFAFAL